MRKYLCLLLATLLLLAGCPNPDVPDSEPAPPVDPADVSSGQGTDAADTPYHNIAEIELDLEAGTLTATLSYTKDSRMADAFLLSPNFTVTELVVDGEVVDPEVVGAPHSVDDYTAMCYALPGFEERVLIRYTGSLGGSAISGYARETISPDFTFLRWETFCYPLFATDWHGVLDLLNEDEPLRALVTIRVPEGYIAATPWLLMAEDTVDGVTAYTFDGDLFNINCAIARYEILQLDSGVYYFLPGTDLDAMRDLINPVMAEADRFLQATFGGVMVPKNLPYIAIPDGYGAFAITGKAVFIDVSAFESDYDLRYLIHEYIHLGWNPMRSDDYALSRSRFFDEGFTCYFEARTLGHLFGEAAYEEAIEGYKTRLQRLLNTGYYQLVPLTQYGPNEYGDLSYPLGPILFDALSKLVGRDALDEAMRSFLPKYRDTPVDFDGMCTEFIALLNHDGVEAFFEDWVYTTRGVETVL